MCLPGHRAKPSANCTIQIILMIRIAPRNSKLSEVFDKYINVFGVHNFATPKYTCQQLKHAAGVMAQGPNSMGKKLGRKVRVKSHLSSSQNSIPF